MTVKLLKIADIKIGTRLRSVDADHVAVLAISISECGRVQQPIIVHENKRTKKLELVAGAHRIAAAKKVGLELIPADVLKDKSRDELLLIEIDENLIRHELNAFDRATSLAERKEAYERLHPEARHGGDRKNQTAKVATWSFSTEASEKTGLAERTIRLAVEMHKRLSPEVRKLVDGSPLARNQSELIKLSKLEPKLQVKVAALVLDPAKAASKIKEAAEIVSGAKPKPQKNSSEEKIRKTFDAFNRMNKREQDKFLRLIGEDRLAAFLTPQAILRAAD